MDMDGYEIVVPIEKIVNKERMYVMCRRYDLSYFILATDNTYI